MSSEVQNSTTILPSNPTIPSTPPPSCPTPLKSTNSLSSFPYFEIAPIIGREYPTLRVTSLLRAPNANQLIRDLAIVISERGVVFLRDQDDLGIEDQKKFTDLLGRLSGRPEENGLHVHPIWRDPGNAVVPETGERDENVYVINIEAQKRIYKTMPGRERSGPRDLSREWHSDSTFEPCPSDYTFLKMIQTPQTGGDTLWASGYDVYDRLSPSFRTYLSTLTATCSQPVFCSAAAAGGYAIASPRGSPLNIGTEFAPSHPVIRTNRVTGWRSVFAGCGLHVSRIDGVHDGEDRLIREFLLKLIVEGHAGVARMRWDKGSCAVWDNAGVWHAATPDTHLVEGNRIGVRTTSIGEVPFLTPESKGRRETLGLPLF